MEAGLRTAAQAVQIQGPNPEGDSDSLVPASGSTFPFTAIGALCERPRQFNDLSHIGPALSPDEVHFVRESSGGKRGRFHTQSEEGAQVVIVQACALVTRSASWDCYQVAGSRTREEALGRDMLSGGSWAFAAQGAELLSLFR